MIYCYLEISTVNTITEEDLVVCDQDIALEEIDKAINNLKEQKSPGLNGLTP